MLKKVDWDAVAALFCIIVMGALVYVMHKIPRPPDILTPCKEKGGLLVQEAKSGRYVCIKAEVLR